MMIHRLAEAINQMFEKFWAIEALTGKFIDLYLKNNSALEVLKRLDTQQEYLFMNQYDRR